MDPITMGVIGHSMVSIAEEMGVNLYQAAHCTAIREMRDIGTALFDAEGHTVALANWVPMLMNAMEPASQRINQDYRIAELKPGEALLTNGPAGGGGLRKSVAERIGIVSTLLPRAKVAAEVTLLQSRYAAKAR